MCILDEYVRKCVSTQLAQMGEPFMLVFPLIGVSQGPLCLVRPGSQYLSQVLPLILKLCDAQCKYELLKDCLRVITLRAQICCYRLLRWLELEGEHLCLH